MKLSEVYVSVQGEGPRVGQPTVFVRFGGCNLRCPGWPCDTPYAIDPRQYRAEWKPTTITNLINQITLHHVHNICFTGGEPMLHYRTGLSQVITHLFEAGYQLEMFSNGTVKYPKHLYEHVDVVMDWKLPGSGEAGKLEDVRLENARNLARLHKAHKRSFSRDHAVKFTIASWEDFEYACDVYEMLWANGYHVPVYYGVVWGRLDNATLIGWVLEKKLPWIFTMQVHNHVWDRKDRGI